MIEERMENYSTGMHLAEWLLRGWMINLYGWSKGEAGSNPLPHHPFQVGETWLMDWQCYDFHWQYYWTLNISYFNQYVSWQRTIHVVFFPHEQYMWIGFLSPRRWVQCSMLIVINRPLGVKQCFKHIFSKQ